MKKGMEIAIASMAGAITSFVYFYCLSEASPWHYSQWSAAWFQAIGSLLAVAVALFYPLYTQRNEIRQIEKLVAEELRENAHKISEILRFYREGIPEHVPVSVEEMAVAKADTIGVDLWQMYRERLAIGSPKVYNKYKETNKYVEYIVYESRRVNPAKAIFQKDSAETFDKLYRKNFL